VSKRKKHTPEQVIAKLREADVALSQGSTIAEVCKRLEVSEQTYHRWRTQFGGMKALDMKQLKELQRENSQLKKLVADQALDISMLKELAKGNF
jgi:transposase-like protein